MRSTHFAALTSALIVLATSCSVLNRTGVDASCADLDIGASACAEGIITRCADGAASYEVCDDASVCEASWQRPPYFVCSETNVPRCGNGVIETMVGEECDDGIASAACNADCTVARCGDGRVNDAAGEQCDDEGESATCNADCTVARCGDGRVNGAAGEQCDDEGESATCNGDCTVARCGDGRVNGTAGEHCDDGVTTDCEHTTDCGGACVDTTSNNQHCGICGNSCGANFLCEAATCACLLTQCGESCADVSNDSKHCGGCNIDCQGGECKEGVCQSPVTVIAGRNQISALAAGGGKLFWSEDQKGVWTCDAQSCEKAPTSLVTSSGNARAMLTYGGRLFWTTVSNTVESCAVSGCGNAAEVIGFGLGSPSGVAVNSMSIYWAETGSPVIQKCASTGCGNNQNVFVESVYSPRPNIALSDTSLLWMRTTRQGSSLDPTLGYEIVKCPLAGCGSPPTVLVAEGRQGSTSGSAPSHIVVAGTSVFWTDENNFAGGGVKRCGLEGCAIPTVLAAVSASELLVDESNVIWLDTQGKRLQKCSVTGCDMSPSTVAGSVGHIAADDTYIYWSTLDGKSIKRMAKTALP